MSWTPTASVSPTANPALGLVDVFNVNLNVFNTTTQGSVSIYVGYSQAGTPYSLKVYNSAGEFIMDLSQKDTSTPIFTSYLWNGRNFRGDACASGIYILYLVEPYDRKLKRLILIR
jgi:flagellar hook assembly protein FlgD